MNFPSPFTRLGTPDKFNSPDYPNRSIFHVWASPLYHNHATFTSRQEMYAYCQLTNKIKTENAQVTTQRDDRHMSDSSCNDFHREVWIKLIKELVERLGIHCVSHDI